MNNNKPVLLGKGTYGETYRPYPIDCYHTRPLVPKSNFVGKLSNLSKTNPNEYSKLQSKRRYVDPYGLFTIAYRAYCKKTKFNAQKWKYFPNSEIEYVYDYGGISFDHLKIENIRDNKICTQQVFYSFRHIIQGLVKMSEKRIVHFDIKLANIVYNHETNVSKLIDYDLMLSFHEIDHVFRSERRFKDVLYFAWPPEINFIYNNPSFFLKNNNISNKLMSSEMSWLSHYTPKGTTIFNDFIQYSRSRSFGNRFIDPSKIDVYSLGIVFSHLFWDSNPHIWSLAQKMIQPDPVLRIHPVDLLREYNKVNLLLSK
jgi:serine/threonine protein kinase